MKIEKATIIDLKIIRTIVNETINTIYPHYYPSGAVDYFIKHHSNENIVNDINNGIVYLLYDRDKTVGTVTLLENEINRLFVLPQYQGMGYGKALLDFAEKKIFESYDTIRLHASFAAKRIYLNRGYSDVDYLTLETENGDYLCVDVMEKKAKVYNL